MLQEPGACGDLPRQQSIRQTSAEKEKALGGRAPASRPSESKTAHTMRAMASALRLLDRGRESKVKLRRSAR
jgi:hypothetical protein